MSAKGKIGSKSMKKLPFRYRKPILKISRSNSSFELGIGYSVRKLITISTTNRVSTT